MGMSPFFCAEMLLNVSVKLYSNQGCSGCMNTLSLTNECRVIQGGKWNFIEHFYGHLPSPIKYSAGSICLPLLPYCFHDLADRNLLNFSAAHQRLVL